MLNQIQTGKFIAAIRKSKNLTQKELAEKLGISDKTVSKWETGRGMPDVSIMGPLCEILEININELLSGERLSIESYNGKAEENMMNLIKKSEEEKRKHSTVKKISAVTGFLLMIAALVWTMKGSSPDKTMNWYIDVPTTAILVEIIFLLLITSGTVGDFFRAFSVCYGSKEYSKQDAGKALNAIQFAMKGILLTGVFASLVSFIATIRTTVMSQSDLSLLGYMMATCIIPFLYCVIWDMFLLPIENKLKNIMT